MQPPEVPADKEQRAIKKGEELGFTSREPSETKEEGRGVMRRHVRTPTRSLYCRARRLNDLSQEIYLGRCQLDLRKCIHYS